MSISQDVSKKKKKIDWTVGRRQALSGQLMDVGISITIGSQKQRDRQTENSQHSQGRKGSSAAIPKSHHLRVTCILHANSRIDPKNHLLKGTAGLNRCCIKFQPCQSVKCLKLDRRLWYLINGLFPLPDPGFRNQGSLTDVTLHIKCYVPIPRYHTYVTGREGTKSKFPPRGYIPRLATLEAPLPSPLPRRLLAPYPDDQLLCCCVQFQSKSAHHRQQHQSFGNPCDELRAIIVGL